MGKYAAGLSTEDGLEVTIVVAECKARVFGCSNRGRRWNLQAASKVHVGAVA